MAIVVELHSMALPSFASWRARLLAQMPGDSALYAIMREALKDWLRKTAGAPPGCAWHPDMTPPRYVAKFTAAVWVHFLRKTKDNGRTLEVIVIGVSDSPTAD